MNVIQWYIGLCQGLNETNRDLDYLFTIEELEATFISMKGGTSLGIDGISIDLLKC